jgi:hypothetical protein
MSSTEEVVSIWKCGASSGETAKVPGVIFRAADASDEWGCEYDRVHMDGIAPFGIVGKGLGDGVDVERMIGPIEGTEMTEMDDGKAKIEDGVCGWVGVLQVVLEVEGERKSIGFEESGGVPFGEQKWS